VPVLTVALLKRYGVFRNRAVVLHLRWLRSAQIVRVHWDPVQSLLIVRDLHPRRVDKIAVVRNGERVELICPTTGDACAMLDWDDPVLATREALDLKYRSQLVRGWIRERWRLVGKPNVVRHRPSDPTVLVPETEIPSVIWPA
jgi:hypothetical protein